ncbi:hypothetical protein AALC17_14980 [Oscillospiraceae bacterium 38-13]
MASIKKIEGKAGTSYKIVVTQGVNVQGKKIRHFKTWTPDHPMTARQMEKEAQRVALDFEREIELGYQVDNRQTFEQYARYVIQLREQRGAAKRTIEMYEYFMERIVPAFGHMKLLEIRPQHLNAFYRDLEKPGARNRGRQGKTPDELPGFAGQSRKNRPLVPPAPEQAALLNVLQMRKSVRRDELDQSVRQMEGCPTALVVLADLADKHKILGFRYKKEREIAYILNKTDTLEHSARKLLQAGLAAADRRVPKDVTYCMYSCGHFNPVPREGADTTDGVRSEDLVPSAKDISDFCAAVDG